MFYSLYTLIVLFSPFLSFVTFFFFFNKEIMGDKLEEEEKKTLAIYDEVEKYIHIYMCMYFKTNIILREYCLKYFQMDVVKSIRGMTNGRSVFVKMMDS